MLFFLLLPASALAQAFVPQWALQAGLVSPGTLGLPDDTAPPDLDEPQIGEDPETAPSAQWHREPARRRPGRPVHFGQNHGPPPPLPLPDRLRRVLRDSPLGGERDFWFARKSPRDVYFLALEGGRHDRYFSLGSKHGVRGTLDAPGWRFLSTLGIKIAAFDPTLNARTSTIDNARMMPGYETRIGGLTLAAYAGLGYARSSPKGILATGRFGRYGASIMGEFWYDWGRANAAWARYTSGYGLGETATRSATLGLRHGMAPFGLGFTLGPEASWNAGQDVRSGGRLLHGAIRKQRLGLHASEIPLFAARLRLSGGLEWQNGRKPGGYAELAAYLPY